MKGKRLSSKSQVGKGDVEKGPANQSEHKVVLGDLIWVKINDSLWWPAQVVDENAVSGSNKPGNRSVGEVLVRLYGSYKYLYADPIECRSEFENVLKKNNSCYREIFQTTLDQVIRHFKPSTPKGQGSRSKEKASVGASNGEKLKQNRVGKEKKLKASNSTGGASGRHKAVQIGEASAWKINSLAKNGEGNVSETIVSSRKLAANAPQVVENGRLSSKRAQKEGKKTPKEFKVQKRLKPKDSSGKKETENGSSRQNQKQKRLQANGPKKEDQKRKISKRDGVQKKLKSSDLGDNEVLKGKTSDRDRVLKKPKKNSRDTEEERKSKTSRRVLKRNRGNVDEQTEDNKSEHGMEKKPKRDHPSLGKAAKKKAPASDSVLNKCKAKSQKADAEVKNKISGQDGSQKKRKPSNPKIEEDINKTQAKKKTKRNSRSIEEAKGKTSKRDGKQNELKQNSPEVSRNEAKRKIPKQDKMQIECERSSPTSVTTLSGKSQEPTARRMRVMQSLGLIAPSGSPFHRNGDI
ncbi:uncharacterized protein LOC131162381 [Malania oleifera]|uniref:uncharacterized protein LOC131162381 n=1 Tax=Malania oleifera TaxID=397392 RepID=UPI0025ADFA1D|nr:uncharacterized protein LOC131162381 [Malania oleifera]